MIEKYDAVLFDLDGTLIDSMWMWHDIDVEYLARYNITIPDDLGQAIEGMSYTETAIYFKERFNIPESIEQIKATWTKMTRDIYCTRVPVKKGVIRFLKYLKGNGIKTAIGTSNSEALARDVMKAVGLDEYIDILVTACMVSGGKPKPDIYLKAASELHVEPSKCLVFEDIPQGVMSGKNAGMTTVAVFDEASKELTAEKIALADYYVTDMEEFMEIYC